MTTWLFTALGVILLPGVATLVLAKPYGLLPGIVILGALVLWLIATVMAAQDGRNIPIQPEIFGGQTIGHSQTGGMRDMAWAAFVLAPATLWAAIALFIGWLIHRKPRTAP